MPKNIEPGGITLTQALGLLSLPREIARHPETKDPILAGIGRFGPYVQHGKTYASIGKDDDILSIGENRAIDLIVAKESGLTGRRFGDAASAPTRVLGQHPAGGDVVVKAGRYGPYVNYGKINATLPPDADATTLTLEDAIALVAAKAAGQGRKSEHPGPPAWRASQGWTGNRARGTVRTLCQSRQHQCDLERWHVARDDHA